MVRRICTVLCATLLAAACGGGGDGAKAASGTTSPAPASTAPPSQTTTSTASTTTIATTTTTTTTAAAPAAATAAVGKTVYIAGLKVEVQTVAFDAASITFDTRITNDNNTDDIVADQLQRTPITLVPPGGSAIDLSYPTLPKVAVGGTVPLKLTGRQPRPALASVTGAQLVFGSSTNNQSTITLPAGDTKTFVPKRDFANGVRFESPAIRMEILQSNLRATYRFEGKGRYDIHILMKGTGKVAATGGYGFGVGAFTLVTPTGNRIAGEAPADGLFLNEVLNLDVTKQNWIRFTTEETTGAFKILWKGPASNPAEAAEASFTIA